MRLRSELSELRYELTSSGKMKIHHPDGGHNDHATASSADQSRPDGRDERNTLLFDEQTSGTTAEIIPGQPPI